MQSPFQSKIKQVCGRARTLDSVFERPYGYGTLVNHLYPQLMSIDCTSTEPRYQLITECNVKSLYGGPLVDFLGPPHHVLVLADGKELAGLFKEIIIRIIAFIY